MAICILSNIHTYTQFPTAFVCNFTLQKCTLTIMWRGRKGYCRCLHLPVSSHLKLFEIITFDFISKTNALMEIMVRFSGVFTIDKMMSMQKIKVKVTEVKTNFALIWVFQDHNSCLNLQMATKWCTKLAVTQKRCLLFFQGHLSNLKVSQAKESILPYIDSF